MYCLRTDISLGLTDRLYLIPTVEVCKSNRFLEFIVDLFFIYVDITFSFENMDSENYQKV